MTVEQILIVVFGIPSVSLLMGIYHKMGKIEGTHEGLKTDLGNLRESIRLLWSEIHKLKEQV